MAVVETTGTTDPTAATTPAAGPGASGGGTLRVMAMGLWGVVGTLLGYGILQTVLKASALFG